MCNPLFHKKPRGSTDAVCNVKKTIVLTVLMLFGTFSGAVYSVTIPELWVMVERGIKTGEHAESEAKALMEFMRPELDEHYVKNGGVVSAYNPVFPVSGGLLVDAYRKGYYVRCYNFYKAENCNDHPAVDVFIEDINRDCIDDRYKKPADVLSMSPGVVLTVVDGWEPGSLQRGGNIVWVYDPVTKGLFYYAHLKTVAVCTGQIIPAGHKLGTVGRTGSLAFEKRSQTHLHIMYVKYGKDGTITPQDVSSFLVKSRRNGEEDMVNPVSERRVTGHSD